LFTIIVCAELRKQFGIPVDRLKYVQDFMLQEGADHLAAAVDLMSSFGVGVWLCTDFDQTFILDSELEFDDLWRVGYFSAHQTTSFVFLNVWPIVNALLGCLKDPIHFEAHGAGYVAVRGMRDLLAVRSDTEREILDMIRSGDYESVEVTNRDGEVHTIKSTKRIEPGTNLKAALAAAEYQNLSISQRGGKVSTIT